MGEISTQLLVTLGGNAISGAIILIGGLFVFTQNPTKRLNQLFTFLAASTLLYTIFFIISGLQTDKESAYFWWHLNIFDVFITMSVTHFLFAVVNKEKEWRYFIYLTYIVGVVIFALGFIFPLQFLPDVVPKMYFPFYLTAGPIYSAMLFHFLVFPFIAFCVLLREFVRSGGVQRKRYEYVVLMMVVGYIIGCTNFLLVYDIPVDPFFGMFMGFYFLPIAYGIFADNLLDIRLVVKRAFFYGVWIALIAAFLSLLSLLNGTLVANVPYLQFWTVPLGVSIVSVLVGRAVWAEIKETERLKYEFITIATHKLRTPLTRIRWEVPPLLEKTNSLPEVQEGIRRIDAANNRLIELTNVLMDSARSEDTASQYTKTRVNMSSGVDVALLRFDTLIAQKKIHVDTSRIVATDMPLADAGRIYSVIDVLIENAVMYTPDNGTVTVSSHKVGDRIRFEVTDTGIGLSPEDATRIFSGFFRADSAKRVDTEGVGIGLTIAKSIIEKHGGTIGVISGGEGSGATFWLELPID